MAVDALEYDESAEDANPASALSEILESPERLKDLDLDAFAEELERQVCLLKTVKYRLDVFYIRSFLFFHCSSNCLFRTLANRFCVILV